MTDMYDNGTPKYSTAQDIYDALCEMEMNEEAGILGDMFENVSWEGQDYYYTDAAYKLKERFEAMFECGNKMWVMDLAVWQLKEHPDVHDLVWDILHNDDLAKRIGFKKMFIDEALLGVKANYEAIIEDWTCALGELDRFDYYNMRTSLQTVVKEHGHYPVRFVYDPLCSKLYAKLKGLRLDDETRLITECRAMLTGYDDFMFGLRANQQLFEEQKRAYQNRMASLEANYKELVSRLLLEADRQGVVLTLPDMPKMIAEPDGIAEEYEESTC